MFKKELELEERIRLLEKEIDLMGDDAEKVKRDLEVTSGSLRIEIESLKMILEEMVPDFREKFRSVKNTVLREKAPERTCQIMTVKNIMVQLCNTGAVPFPSETINYTKFMHVRALAVLR